MVSVGLYKAAVDSARSKTTEIEQKQSELQALRQKYSSLALQLEQKEKAHNNSLTVARKQDNEKEGAKQRIALLESELLRERQTSEAAAEAAKEESEKHKSTLESLNKLRGEVADLKWELQESGSNFHGNLTIGKSPSPRRVGLQDSSSQPSRGSPPMTPSTTTPRVVCNKENAIPSPLTGTKTPSRNKFSFVKSAGGRKGLSQRVQQMRSPRARQTIMM